MRGTKFKVLIIKTNRCGNVWYANKLKAKWLLDFTIFILSPINKKHLILSSATKK